MCRLALQLLGMLGNVLGRPRHALQRPRHALQGPWPIWACFYKVLRVPHRRKPPPTCYLISCEAKRVVYHQASLYCGDQLPLEVLFKLDRLGLWLNNPV